MSRGQSGSLQNLLASNATQSYAETPEVGTGVTIVGYTDRYAATVIRIIAPDKIIVQYDDVQYNYPSGSPKEITRDPNGRTEVVRRTGRGKFAGQWRYEGMTVMIGIRDPYYDHQF